MNDLGIVCQHKVKNENLYKSMFRKKYKILLNGSFASFAESMNGGLCGVNKSTHEVSVCFPI